MVKTLLNRLVLSVSNPVVSGLLMLLFVWVVSNEKFNNLPSQTQQDFSIAFSEANHQNNSSLNFQFNTNSNLDNIPLGLGLDFALWTVQTGKINYSFDSDEKYLSASWTYSTPAYDYTLEVLQV